MNSDTAQIGTWQHIHDYVLLSCRSGSHPDQTTGNDMTNQNEINADAINTHMHAWNGTQGAQLDACTGFAVWAQYMLEKTRAALVAGDLEQIADDVVYSLAQAHHEVTDEQATEWIDDNLEGLIAAIDPKPSK